MPQAWIDVRTMADLDEVAVDLRARHGRKMRVATKYVNLTRRFFAGHGVAVAIEHGEAFAVLDHADAVTEGFTALTSLALAGSLITTGLVVGALQGLPKPQLLSPLFSPVRSLWGEEPLDPEIA